jgi:hypothetical protein
MASNSYHELSTARNFTLCSRIAILDLRLLEVPRNGSERLKWTKWFGTLSELCWVSGLDDQRQQQYLLYEARYRCEGHPAGRV